MKRKKMFQFLSVALSVVMITTMLPDASFKFAAAAEDDSDYSATPETAREITSGTGDERTWKIDWSDEFNGASLDTSKWSYMIGTGAEYSGDGWGNNEQEYYTNGENAVVSDGTLAITARKLSESEKPSYGGKSYSSSRIWSMDDSSNPGGSKTTKFSKKYGRIEAKIKITSDAADGDSTGLWPAFWMMPEADAYGTWAASGEIDIMETRGSNTGVVDGTIHYGSLWPNNKSNGGNYKPENTSINYDENFTTADYHTYAIEWLPGEIRWYMDDQLYYKTSNWYSTSVNNASDFTYPAPFDQNFYILLNLAVGGNYDGGALSDSWNNAEMDVDYVRVYDLVDNNTGEIADYDAMEAQAVKPVDKPDDTLVSGVINETNYVSSALSDIKATSSYPTESENEWYLSTMLDGAATAGMVDADTLKIDVTAPGTQNYSVQMIHNAPLTKGYRYVLTFDAKADAAKSLSAKFGNIAGYPAYSDSYSVDLTADWKNYTYVFDMTNTTDATGRIEFNMGLTTGACYYKNFSLICTGLTPTQGADDAKVPLANGNHVYNGTFDQGTGRTYYWHAGAGTDISVEKAYLELKAAGTSDNSYVFQKGMNLLSSDTYQVTFDAKGAVPGAVTVKLVSSDGTVTYGEKTINIDSSYTTDPYSFEFTMPESITDTQGILEIVTGNNTVYMDNISMIRTTNNHMDWSKVDFWPLYNSDFFNGDDGWNIWSENAGVQTHTVTDGVLSVNTTIGANPDFWCVGVQSSSIPLTANIPYKFTVHLNGSKNKTIKIETPDGTQTDYNFTAGDNTLSIEFKPTKDLNGKFSMYFGIGEGAYNFTIDSIDVEVDSSKITIPEGHAKPASLTSAGNVKAGNDIVLKFSDSVWASKITTAYINGSAIEASAVQVNNDGTLTIAGRAMPNEGTYSIKFDAEDYAQTKAITQTVLEASGNAIVNGTFDTDFSGWTTYFSSWNVNNLTGTASVEDGKAVINVLSTEGNNWDGQLKQSGINVETNQYYILQFDASSSVDRPIQLEFGGLGTASQTIVNITEDTDTYYIVLSGVTASAAASVLFMTGNVNGCLADFPSVGAHNIYFDNIKLYAASKSQVDALQVPTLTLTDSVVLGEDIVYNYTDNSVWESKPITVSADGNDITASVVIDKAANTITIDGSSFTQPGTYNLSIKAEGYKAITAAVRVLGSKNENLFVGDWVTGIFDGDQGSVTCLDNSFTVDFVSTVTSQWNGPEFWSIQAKKAGITTFSGKKYKLTFDAELIYDDTSVTDNRGLVVEMGSAAVQPVIPIKPGKESYEYEVTPGANADFYILFLAGGNDFGVKAHTLQITNIKFAEAIAPVAVTGVTLDRETLTMSVSGSAITLHATVSPENAANKNVIWSTDNSAVATVDNGTVIASATGSAIITVTTQDGGYEDSCVVIVEDTPAQANILSVSATNGAINVVLDMVPETAPVLEDFTVTANINGGIADDITPAGFDWDGESKTVTIHYASIAQTLQDQSVIITVTYHGASVAAGAFTVAAIIPPVVHVTSISVSGENQETIVQNGRTLQLYASVLPNDATDASVTWSVENGTGRAVISANGLLTATQDGSVTVKATAKDGSGISGTIVISIYTPADTTVPTNPTPADTPSGQDNEGEGHINIDLSDMEASDGTVTLPISKGLSEALSNPEITEITIGVSMPKNESTGTASDSSGKSAAVVLSTELLQAVRESGKSLTVSILNEENKAVFSWTFDAKQLASSEQNLADINITIERLDFDEIEGFDETSGVSSPASGIAFRFAQEGILPSQAKVRIYVGDQEGFTQGTRIYLYHYNPATGRLETLPYSSDYVVDSEGYVSINIIHCSDYVALLEQAATGSITSLKDQISITADKKTLYLGGKKDKSTQIKIELPSTLELVKSLTDTTSQSVIGGVTVSYSSSDKKVAAVDQTGVITAVGTGTAVITTKLTLYSGKIKTVKTAITVKKADIIINSKTSSLEVGDTYTFKAEGLGVETKDIVWSTTKKSILVINSKTGKATAKSAGTDYVLAKVGSITKKIKVVVK